MELLLGEEVRYRARRSFPRLAVVRDDRVLMGRAGEGLFQARVARASGGSRTMKHLVWSRRRLRCSRSPGRARAPGRGGSSGDTHRGREPPGPRGNDVRGRAAGRRRSSRAIGGNPLQASRNMINSDQKGKKKKKKLPRVRSPRPAYPAADEGQLMKVWVDCTAAAHPLVLRPIIERLEAAGHEVEVTARALRADRGDPRAARDPVHERRRARRRLDARQGGGAGGPQRAALALGAGRGASTWRSPTARSTSRWSRGRCGSRWCR